MSNEFDYQVKSPANAEYADASGKAINIDVYFPHLKETVRYTALESDPGWPHSEEIFRRAASGEFGPVAPHKRNLDAEWAQLREERDMRLRASDWVEVPSSNPSNYHAWIAYRQALRDITNDLDDPQNVVWPEVEQFLLEPNYLGMWTEFRNSQLYSTLRAAAKESIELALATSELVVALSESAQVGTSKGSALQEALSGIASSSLIDEEFRSALQSMLAAYRIPESVASS